MKMFEIKNPEDIKNILKELRIDTNKIKKEIDKENYKMCKEILELINFNDFKDFKSISLEEIDRSFDTIKALVIMANGISKEISFLNDIKKDFSDKLVNALEIEKDWVHNIISDSINTIKSSKENDSKKDYSKMTKEELIELIEKLNTPVE